MPKGNKCKVIGNSSDDHGRQNIPVGDGRQHKNAPPEEGIPAARGEPGGRGERVRGTRQC